MSEPSAKQIAEAVLFASSEPVSEIDIQACLSDGTMAREILEELERDYSDRGVRLERQGKAWAFRTAPEVAPALRRVDHRPKKLSKAALETLSIIAYQQPVTRAEIESLRGVSISRGTLDSLVDAGWVAPKGRRDAPGKPVTWVTTASFLDHFGLSSLEDLPRLDELEGAALFRPSAAR